jgi:hypothetical protein
MVLSVAVIVQQHLNGRLILGESPAAFFIGEILPLPLGRTIPKQGAAGFAFFIVGICPLLLVGSIPKQGAAGFAALGPGAFPSDSGICMKSATVACKGRMMMMDLRYTSCVHV